jgi:hypothetical protein
MTKTNSKGQNKKGNFSKETPKDSIKRNNVPSEEHDISKKEQECQDNKQNTGEENQKENEQDANLAQKGVNEKDYNLIYNSTKRQKRYINNKDSIENRRSVRIAVVLAIIAVIISLCKKLYQLCIKTYDNEYIDNKGYSDFSFVLFSVALATALILTIWIIVFLFFDFQRYNISDDQYDKYDNYSDWAYDNMVKYFMFCLAVLLLLIFAFEILFLIPKMTLIMAGIALGILIIYCIKKEVYKKVYLSQEIILSNLRRFFVLAFVVAITASAVFVRVDARPSEIVCKFYSSGKITISNESNHGYKGFYYEIQEDITNIYRYDVNEAELLFANETAYGKDMISSDDSHNEIYKKNKEEKFSWTYYLDLNDLGLSDGIYVFCICSESDTGTVFINNMFSVVNGQYTFAKTQMDKEY